MFLKMSTIQVLQRLIEIYSISDPTIQYFIQSDLVSRAVVINNQFCLDPQYRGVDILINFYFGSYGGDLRARACTV